MTPSPRRLVFALGLFLSLCLSAPAFAYAPGSPENYMETGHGYYAAGNWSGAATHFHQATMLQPENAEAHFMLAAALASNGLWDEARTAFARATALRPDLRPNADAWLAAAPGASPAPTLPAPPAPAPAPAPAPVPGPAPAPAPAPAATNPAGVFAIGDRVEVMYREGFWIPGIVTYSDPGACPYYRVRADAYGNGDPSELGYFCKSIRAPTGLAPVVAQCGGSNGNCPPTSPPPAGAYHCTEQVWQGPGANPQYRPRQHGTITLMGGDRYRHYDDGAVGSFRYDRSTHRIHWSGGGLDGRGAVATYGLDGDTPEITVDFPTDHTRATGNTPPRWQCGLGR